MVHVNELLGKHFADAEFASALHHHLLVLFPNPRFFRSCCRGPHPLRVAVLLFHRHHVLAEYRRIQLLALGFGPGLHLTLVFGAHL